MSWWLEVSSWLWLEPSSSGWYRLSASEKALPQQTDWGTRTVPAVPACEGVSHA